MLILWNQKVMKLTYTWKTTFNINGMTIHLALVIPLNKNFNELKTLSDEKWRAPKFLVRPKMGPKSWICGNG
jgi:hypothetical protein